MSVANERHHAREDYGDEERVGLRGDGPSAVPDPGGDRDTEEYGCQQIDGSREAEGRASGYDRLPRFHAGAAGIHDEYENDNRKQGPHPHADHLHRRH